LFNARDYQLSVVLASVVQGDADGCKRLKMFVVQPSADKLQMKNRNQRCLITHVRGENFVFRRRASSRCSLQCNCNVSKDSVWLKFALPESRFWFWSPTRVAKTSSQGRNDRCQGVNNSRVPNHCGGAKSSKNVTSTFFNEAHSFLKNHTFERGSAKLATAPRHRFPKEVCKTCAHARLLIQFFSDWLTYAVENAQGLFPQRL